MTPDKTVEQRATEAAKRGRVDLFIGPEEFWAFARRLEAKVEEDVSIVVHTKHGKVRVRP